MPAVFVHGVPESDAIWGPLLAELNREDTICLSPPGFGAGVPDGWTATRVEYLGWLVGELEKIEGPIDLVGHDWGAGHVAGVVATRPDLIRSWATDCGGLLHRDYVWHDLAQVWQTPEAGEELVAVMASGTVEERAERYVGLGLPDQVAVSVAEASTPVMSDCILRLYRSAAQPALAEFGATIGTASARPGLSLFPTEDPYAGPVEQYREVAELSGATMVTLEGAGHWWQAATPAPAAAALEEFWASLDD